MKKMLIIIIIAILLLLTSCTYTQQKNAIVDYDYSEMNLHQLEAHKKQEHKDRPVAVITTTLGEIKVALYPEYAPNTVANFIDRINEGFYDDSPILMIQEEVFFQAGVNTEGQRKTDEEGVPIEIDNEYSVNMWPFKGAIGSYGNIQGISDSRFFMVNEQAVTDEQLEWLREKKNESGEQMLPDELINAFEENGGAIPMSGFFTIFGQTIEGIEIVETICKSAVDSQSIPIDEIKIIKIELAKFD